MSTTVSDPGGGNDFDPIPEGLQHGICYAVYDLGHHWESYQNKPGKWTEKVRIAWELPDHRIQYENKEGKQVDMPMSISQEFTNSLFRTAKLRIWLKKWRKKDFTKEELEGFKLSKLLGVNCALEIIHNEKDDKMYANIEITKPFSLMTDKQTKQPENPLIHFNMESGLNVPEQTPNWIKEKIMKSREWLETFDSEPLQEPPGGPLPPDNEPAPNDDIPF